MAPTPRAAAVEKEVRSRYLNPRATHDYFLEWTVKDHLFVVLEESQRLAERFGANLEYCYVGALLHDVGDAWFDRNSVENSDELTRQYATEILLKEQFTPDEVSIIVGDIIRFHGCRGSERPASLEGKCVAAADAIAHFRSALYFYGAKFYEARQISFSEFISWMRGKLDRDFMNKIHWEDEREKIRPLYETLKTLIARW